MIQALIEVTLSYVTTSHGTRRMVRPRHCSPISYTFYLIIATSASVWYHKKAMDP